MLSEACSGDHQQQRWRKLFDIGRVNDRAITDVPGVCPSQIWIAQYDNFGASEQQLENMRALPNS